MSHKVLFVDADRDSINLLQPYFVHAGFDCHGVDQGRLAMDWLDNNLCDLIIMDVELSDVDGVQLCRDMHAQSLAGILILSNQAEEYDRLVGLDAGADDYIGKSCSPQEVLARANALLRRLYQPALPLPQIEELTLDSQRYRVIYNGEALLLTTVEFHLLRQLLLSQGGIVSRDKLLGSVYQDNRIVTHRTIDSHIKNIRKKLKAQFPETEFIHSVYGIGYKLEISKIEEKYSLT